MRCRDIQQFASAMVDGELDAATALEFERHIGMCEDCRTRTESERLIKRELRRHLGGVRAPEALRSRIHDALGAASTPGPAGTDHDARRRRAQREKLAGLQLAARVAAAGAAGARWRARLGFVPYAVAAGLVLFFVFPRGWLHSRPMAGAGGARQATMGGTLFVSDVAGKHARSLPLEVDGPSPERVGHWFQGKVDFPVRPPVFSQVRADLLGGRVSWVRDQPAAHLYYDLRGRRVSVMIFTPPRRRLPLDGVPGLCVPGRTVYVGRSRGVNVAFVQQDKVAYALASDVPEQQVLGLATGF